ncbi:MAG: hypothetical protein N2560_01570 [Ignavibacteria bacterium]|nr:hypothetical protein [Ignavibacteria bacterium]
MKIVLITTTIYVPEVLRLYRKLDPDVKIIIAGDRKTPHDALYRFVKEIDNAVYLSDTDQEKLGYECSEIIGWNKIMRRNIALLEAIKEKPDIIITIDDDNIPLEDDYFKNFESTFSNPFSGLLVTIPSKWFNIGEFLEPPVYHRGFPYEQRNFTKNFQFKPVVDKNVAISAGLWLGDPDINAMDRIVNRPIVVKISEVLSKGIIVDNQIFTPFNTQNTACKYEFASLLMVLVGVGRYDDIWASYIAERILMETDYYVHFGKPWVWQERNPQSLWKNLRDELFGMEYTIQFCNDLLEANLGEGSVLDKLNRLYEHLKTKSYLPEVVYQLGKAWCKDIEKIM